MEDSASNLNQRIAERVRECSKTLLALDAVTGGDGARLCERLGWIRAGNIPDYALQPRGGFCNTTFYDRNLRS